VFLGCRPEEPEILDFSDIVAESENYPEGDAPEANDNEIDSTKAIKELFNLNGIQVSELTFVEERLFPDRFGPKNIEKYKLAIGEDSILYCKWRYKDSAKVMNALYNWIDCFGENCKSIYVNESKNMQRNPLKIMVSDTTLVFIEALESLDFKEWDAFHESLGYKNDWNLIIEQRKSGRAKWFMYRNEEKIPFEE
jgi:hypothetical protein